MRINCLNLGELATNCYCVSGEDFAFVVDPADTSDELIYFVTESTDKKHKYILLTHCHIDHILGVNAIKQIWNCPIVIGKEDAESLKDPKVNLSGMIFGFDFSIKADITVAEGDKIDLGEQEICVLETPGHTKGSVCYILGEHMFSGDTLFKGTIGNTNFPTSNTCEMLKTLKKLAEMDTDYKLYPGHDSATTLFYEKKYNRFMRLNYEFM